MLNSGFRGKRATDGLGAISAQNQLIQSVYPVPIITGWAVTNSSYVAFDDTAATSGAIIVVYGNNFVSDMTVYINNSSVSATYLDSTRITFTAPTLSNGTYAIYITTPQGAAAILAPGIVYSGFPTWTESSYSSTSTTLNIQLLVSGNAPFTYSLQGGSTLPTGITLTSTGLLTGTATSVTSNSVFDFTVIVDDAQLQSTQQLITLYIQFGDSNFNQTTLLLNGETTVTPFISDASTNSFRLTISGDIKPNNFNPYTPGYYSNYFDGSSASLSGSLPVGGLGSGSFCVEGWIYPTTRPSGDNGSFLDTRSGTSVGTGAIFGLSTTNGYPFIYTGGSFIATASVAPGLNTWSHLAYVRNGSAITLYLNGVSVATGTTSNNLSDRAFRIASTSAGGAIYFQSYISNFRVVVGSAVYTSAFTPSTTPLTAIANTSLLTCQSNRFIDNSPNALAITLGGTPQIAPAIPFTPNSSYSTYGSAYFDGTTDFITAVGSGAIVRSSGSFTIEGWYFPTSAAAVFRAVYSSGTGYSTAGRLYQNNTTLTFYWGSGAPTSVTGTIDWTLNVWQHFAVTWDGTTTNIYINGQQSASTTSATFSGTVDLSIGESTYSPFGYISNFRIVSSVVYTAAFTPSTTPLTAIANTQLLTLQYNGNVNNSNFIDNSNFNNTITRNGNTRQGSFSPYSVTGWSNYFNGSTGYLDVTAGIPVPLTGQFTFEAWIYTTKINGANSQMIYSQYSTSNANRWTINISTGNKLVVTHPTLTVTGATTFPVNQWVHIAITRDASDTLRIFLNGVVDVTSTSYTYSIFQDPPRIGYYKNTPPDYFTGYMSNLRVVSGSAVYTAAFTPSTTPLTAISSTSLLTCQSNRIIDNGPYNYAMTMTGDASVQAISPFGSKSEPVPLSYSVYQYVDSSQINVTYSSSLLVGTGQFTIEAWIYVNATRAVQQTIFSNRTYNNIGTGTYTFYIASTTNLLTFDQVQGPATLATSTIAVTIGVWQHVAVSRDSSNLIRLFINGVLVNTPAASTFNFSSTNNPQIGYNADTNNYVLIGSISNLRFIIGSALYTTGFTTPTSPLTAISNTVLLTCQSTRMIDNSTDALTITTSGDVRARTFNPFGYTAQINTSYTPSLHGGSAYFDGTGDYLTAPYNPYLFGSNDFTVECWVYPIALLTLKPIVGVYRESGTTSSNSSWKLGGGSTSTIAFVYYTSSGTFTSITGSANAYSLNTWTHLAAVRYGSTITIYVNGVLYTSGAISIGLSSPTTTNLGIAADYSGLSPQTAYISDLRIINGTALYTSSFVPPTTSVTAIPKTTLLLNFTSGGIIDQHGTNVLETLGNAQLSTAVKKFNNASMYFDGTGDYLTIPTNPGFVFGTGDFTIEAWFYIVSGAVGAIFDTRSGASGVTPLLYFSSSTLRYYMNGSDRITSGTTLSAATWYHVALVRSSGSSKMYLNGAQTGSTYVDTNDFILTNTINIGRGNDNANVLNGYIDELRITKGFARYTANFTAPTTAFLGQ